MILLISITLSFLFIPTIVKSFGINPEYEEWLKENKDDKN